MACKTVKYEIKNNEEKERYTSSMTGESVSSIGWIDKEEFWDFFLTVFCTFLVLVLGVSGSVITGSLLPSLVAFSDPGCV